MKIKYTTFDGEEKEVECDSFAFYSSPNVLELEYDGKIVDNYEEIPNVKKVEVLEDED